MKLVIHTQHYENYGAHDWDGVGACPQYWKAKGGDEFMVEGVDPALFTAEEVVNMVRSEVEFRNEGFESMILGYGFEQDGYLSSFERSQLEYDGSIAYPERRVQFGDVMARHLAVDTLFV